MVLNKKERAVAPISNGIAAFAIFQELQKLPPNTTIYDFILKSIPEDIKAEVTAQLIDEVFKYVSDAHNS